jgi:mannitol-specific phosphotransferase system IIBC component
MTNEEEEKEIFFCLGKLLKNAAFVEKEEEKEFIFPLVLEDLLSLVISLACIKHEKERKKKRKTERKKKERKREKRRKKEEKSCTYLVPNQTTWKACKMQPFVVAAI